MLDASVTGTRHTLGLARASRVRRFLLSSSGALYGCTSPEASPVQETSSGSPNPMDVRSAYGEGKMVAEHLAPLFSRIHGMESVSARCFAFVGPYLPLDIHYAIGNFTR